MYRIINEVRPRWLIIENVPNLRIRGADGVISALETSGYACWPLLVAAWAVGAPHVRERVWIVAYSDLHGNTIKPNKKLAKQKRHVLEKGGFSHLQNQGVTPWANWKTVTTEGRLDTLPIIYRVDDGLPARLDEMKERIKACGNAVVPQVVEAIGKTIIEIDKRLN